jgi:teichuronic acid biosynthesis glycosyltransferase TuaC
MQLPGFTWEQRDPEADVLYVTNMWPDGMHPVYGIFVKRQIESLRNAGIRCDVLYVRGYQGLYVYGLAAAWFFVRRRRLRKKYRLIHAHAGETALVVAPAGGISKITSYCGDDVLGQARPDGSFSVASRLRRSLIRQSGRACTATITKSAEMADALPASVRRNNTVVPNGIDEQAFRPTDQRDARRELTWDHNDRIVIFVATRPHEPRKRLDLARAAVAEAELKVGHIHLVVAENVTPSELPTMMNAADCLLLTSRMEGSPNAVKEALMCNLPVVSTDVGDVAELLKDVTHSAVCPDRVADLGVALADALRSGERSNGREMRADLTQGRIAKRILEIYRSVGYQASR